MPARLRVDWLPVAAYLYVLHLDGPSLAWEYLRRNPEYRQDWRRRTRPVSRRWGLRLYEDPGYDALQVQPDWLPDPDALIPLQADDDPPEDSPRFTLWQIPGRKQLIHDGRRLALTSYMGNQVLRMAIATDLAHGKPYVYAVRPRGSTSHRWHAIETQLAALEGDAAETTMPRPNRTWLAHMRSLQGLDGIQAGASQRDVAKALFGEREVAHRWHADSELRAQVRHLIRRGRAFMAGEYRRLLQLAGHPHGDERGTPESP